MRWYDYDRTVIGYHGCDAKVAEQLLRGESFKPSQNDYDWLGEGIYFWEYGADRALQFAEDQRARGKVKTPAVVGALLQLGNCFDLMDTRFTKNLGEAYATFATLSKRSKTPLPRNTGKTKDLMLRRLDCAVIKWNLELLAGLAENSIKYDTVRCGFVEGKPAFKGSGIREKSHVQLAVRNPSCIIGVFRPNLRSS